jgi:hypothetical protein
MRLISFLAAIAVLFCLTEAGSAQTVYAGTVTTASYAQSPSARQAGLRTLTWPGKVQEAPPQRRQANAGSRRVWNSEPVALPQATPTPPAPRQQAPLPSNIYDPAPAAAQADARPLAPPAPVRQAQAATQANAAVDPDYQPPHFYSLYRQYGQTPDPIPTSEFDPRSAPAQQLSPQFFASSSPDLAQPPPPVPHTVTTSGGRILQSVPPSPDDNPG